jgi:hypothetical protein
VILESCAKRMPRMLPWIAGLLTEATPLMAVGSTGDIISWEQTGGVRQGCGLGSALFCLGLAEFAEDLSAAIKQIDPAAQVLAYLDDMNILCKQDTAEKAWEHIKQQAPKYGLTLSLNKCNMYTAAGTAEVRGLQKTDKPQVLRQPNYMDESVCIPIRVANNAAEGCWQPANHMQYEQLATKRHRTFQKIRELKEAGLSVQNAWVLLRNVIAGDTTWTARTVGIPTLVAEKLDEQAKKMICWLFNLEPHDLHTERIWHPMKQGGLGATSVQQTAVPAMIASWAHAIPRILATLELADAAALAEQIPGLQPIMQQVSEATQAVQESTHRITISSQTAKTVKQSVIMKKVHETAVNKWHEAAGNNTISKAWVRSCGGQGASAFLTTPVHPGAHMADAHFTLAVQLRMGKVICQCMPCPLKKGNTNACGQVCDSKGHHLICCAAGGCLVRRHDELVATIQRLLKDWGCTHIMLEVPMTEDLGRMDLVFTTPTGVTMHLDATIWHAASQQALRAGSACKDGVAAHLAVQAKYRKYPNVKLVPAALETGGRVSEPFLRLVRSLAPWGKTRTTEMAMAWQLISAALQRENARSIEKARMAWQGHMVHVLGDHMGN